MALCRPCERERRIREKLNSPEFPDDFPCRHPWADNPSSPVQYPVRFTAKRICSECGKLQECKYTVRPGHVIQECKCGHRYGIDGKLLPSLRKWLDQETKFAA